jgi:hypothetical protein
MEFPTSAVNGTKVTDFICTPLTSHWREAKHMHLFLLGRHGHCSFVECDFILFAQVFGLGGSHTSGLAHGINKA